MRVIQDLNLLHHCIHNVASNSCQQKLAICESHTVQKLDKYNVKCIAELESKSYLSYSYNWQLISAKVFFRGKKPVIFAGILAILRLFLDGKFDLWVSLVEVFAHTFECANQVKQKIMPWKAFLKTWIFINLYSSWISFVEYAIKWNQ